MALRNPGGAVAHLGGEILVIDDQPLGLQHHAVIHLVVAPHRAHHGAGLERPGKNQRAWRFGERDDDVCLFHRALPIQFSADRKPDCRCMFLDEGGRALGTAGIHAQLLHLQRARDERHHLVGDAAGAE